MLECRGLQPTPSKASGESYLTGSSRGAHGAAAGTHTHAADGGAGMQPSADEEEEEEERPVAVAVASLVEPLAMNPYSYPYA